MARAILLTTLLLASPAYAADNGVAVLDIQGTGVDPNLLPTLTEVLTVEIDSLGLYKVIAGRDVQAMVGFENQKDLLGCTDAACLAEIGGALGVDRIVASHIGKVGSTFVVNIKLINIRMADTEGRVYETVKGEVDALIDTIRRSVKKLLGHGSTAATTIAPEAKAPPPTPAATAASPAKKPAPPPEPAKVAAASPTKESTPSVGTEVEGGGTSLLVPGLLWGAGAAAIGVGAFFGSKAQDHETNANDKFFPGGQIEAQKAESSALIANICFGVGAAAIGGGLLALLLGGDDAPESASLIPVVTPESTGVAVVGGF